MTKLIIFDLDGVLVDSRDMHYKALNLALQDIAPDFVINRDEHLSTFDGLSTTKKLKILQTRGLSSEFHNAIWKKKQDYTWGIISEEYTYDERIRGILRSLSNRGYMIYVASNSVHKTVKTVLIRKGFMEFIDFFISNEDCINHKPSPEIYFRCMIRANVGCKDTIIIEDSHLGRQAALSSGANLVEVENPSQVTIELIEEHVNKNKPKNCPKWRGKCTVVIPMAGEGSRFSQVGYSFPKPLIDVNGKPMIQVVIENLNLDPEKSKFVFICRKEHMEKYNLAYLLKAYAPNCEIVVTDGLTEGAACSILLAKEYINNEDHLILANSDQFMEWEANLFMYSMVADDIDGGIATFTSSHPKWSYAKLSENGFVCEVAEKKPISTNATTGIYYWKHGSDFVKYAEQMIEKDIRYKGEFYTAPVFNEAIQDKKKIKIFPVQKMWGIGVPEDLNYFLTHYHNSN
jgi:HAD superfamily hydrolase (TIGR01509 family)